MAIVMGLRCEQAHDISVVISGIAHPKVVGSKTGQINGKRAVTISEKRNRNILRKVTPRRHVNSIQSVYFFDA